MAETALSRQLAVVDPANRVLLQVAGSSVAVLAALAFTLSFTALRDLAGAAGVTSELTALWPLVVDGNIVMNTVAAVVLRPRGRRVTWYPWTALTVFAGISVAGNALHAMTGTGGHGLSAPLAAAVSAVPAIALLQSTHLFVVMFVPERDRQATRPFLEPRALTAPATETDRPEGEGETTPSADSEVAPDASAAPPSVELASLVRQAVAAGQTVTGREVAAWLGCSERTGRRRLAELDVYGPDGH